ncbi:MAG TPA: hypothetical protein VF482_03610 [Trebonia sp.]
MAGGRSPEKAAALAGRIGAHPDTLAQAAEFGEAVLLAVRRDGLVTALEQAGAGVGSLAGKTVFDGRPLAIPFAGDDEGKGAVSRLISDLGCDPLDAGDLRQARRLEAMAIVIIRLLFSGYDPYSVFTFASPGRTGQPFASR